MDNAGAGYMRNLWHGHQASGCFCIKCSLFRLHVMRASQRQERLASCFDAIFGPKSVTNSRKGGIRCNDHERETFLQNRNLLNP